MTRVWDDIDKGLIVLEHSPEIPHKLLSLKPAFEMIIRSNQGKLCVAKKDYNMFLLEALNAVYNMICLGFYSTEEEIKNIVTSLISLLDGSLDYYDEFEEREH
jgi:hypothetical protein